MQNAIPDRPDRIIWLALVLSQAAYVFVAFVARGSAAISLAANPLLPLALAVVAVVTGTVAHMFWGRASDEEAELTFLLLAWALDESVAIYGLVQALLGVPIWVWPWFCLAGVALLFMHRPG